MLQYMIGSLSLYLLFLNIHAWWAVNLPIFNNPAASNLFAL